MKRRVFLLAAATLAALVSCHSSTPSSKTTPPQSPAPSFDQKSLLQTTIHLRRQLSFFYIAQNLVQNFDGQLEKVHRQKPKGSRLEADKQNLERLRIDLHITWKLHDQFLQELQADYRSLLESANDPQSFQQKPALAELQQVDRILTEEWAQGDRWAVLSLAQDLEDIHQETLEKHPASRLPEFRKFLKASEKERDLAFKKHLKNFETFKKSHHNRDLEQEWLSFRNKNLKEHLQMSEDRELRKDSLYPDAGSAGNITGNRFAAGVWALTMDDGPHPVHTLKMIQALEAFKLRGTFFWLAQNIKRYSKLSHEADAADFRRGCHSYSHANLPSLPEPELIHEIDEATEVFTQVVGERPTFFRCPYGACGGNGSPIRERIASQNMMHVFWNVDSLDWQDKNPKSIFERVKRQMDIQGHGILLLHDIHPQSVEAMKKIAAYIIQRGWGAYTMDEIYELETGTAYHSP